MSDSAPYRYAKSLVFRAVDLAADAATLIAFGRDLYVESVGGEAMFRRDYGPRGEKFPASIARSSRANPDFAALLVEEDTPIGLVVLGAAPRSRDVGQVHHLYVAAAHRGQGFGGLMDEYARATLKAAGFRRARLNVTARNARALRFYRAQGWEETGRSHGLVWMALAL